MMTVTVPHALTPAEAKTRLDQFADRLKQQFPNEASQITQTWEGDLCTVSGKIRGVSLACELRVSDSEVTARGNLPFLARPFQGTIENAIRNGLEQALTA